jgi:TonB-linked SusC/RagA family outer membrane protein
MKWMVIFLTTALLQANAKSFSQKITFSGREVTLEKVFSVIEQQTNYVVFYNYSALKSAKKITLHVRDVPLDRFLQACFREQPFTYVIEGKTILITPKEEPNYSILQAGSPPPITITGRITDVNGNPLAGVSVVVKGLDKGTQTNTDGEYSLSNVPNTAVLIFSYVGFQKQEVPVQDRIVINLQLRQAVQRMDSVEVMVISTGYQTISRERAAGSYATISAQKLENKLKPDLKSAMEGLAAGMVLTKEGNTEIRGLSTFLTGSDKNPLIVVDGYPISGGFETINVDNVESITVLKDAVAASIYGSRSSNGVIVITTRQAKKGAFKIDYRNSAGIILKPDMSKLNRASASDYIDAEIDLYNENPTTSLNSYNAYSNMSRVQYLLVARSQGVVSAADVDAEIAQLRENDGLGQLKKYLLRTQTYQQHNIAVSGGSEKNTMYASVKYITHNGNMQHAGDNRFIIDFKNDWKPSKSITISLLSNVNYARTEAPAKPASDFTGYSALQTSSGRTLGSSVLLRPYDMIVDPATGQPQDVFMANPRKINRYAAIPGLKPLHYNPLNDLPLEMTKTQDFQVRMGGTIQVQLAKGLSAQAGGVWTRGNTFQRTIYDKSAYRMRLYYDDGTSISNPAKHYIPDGAMADEARNLNQTYTFRGQVNYSGVFGRHNVIAIAGTELTRDTYDNNTYPTRFGYNDLAGNFSTFNYSDFNAGLYNADMLGTSRPVASVGTFNFRDNRFLSWYANGSYEYDKRFVVSGSIRLDQTNFFGTDPKFRYRPLWSAGGMYKLSNEKFFSVPWINKLYVRGSYGINGNISLNSGPFLIITAGTAYSALTGDIPYTIASPPNNSLRWEKTNTINLGTDISFFNSRLNLTLDYYDRSSKDLLGPQTTDPTLGFTSLTRNIGQLSNKGLEVTLDGYILKKRDFNWNVLATVSYNKNRVENYNTTYLYASQLVGARAPMVTGKPADALYSYRYARLNANGSALYYNAANQEMVGSSLLVTDPVYSGTLRPPYSFGLTNTLHYKSFDLSFLLIAKTGNILRRDAFTGYNYQNKSVALRWRNPGDEKNTVYPRLSASTSDPQYFPFSDFLAEDASYIKLRDVSVSYTLPTNRGLLKRVGVTNAKAYVQGRNLWYWAANSDKRDPETAELNTAGSSGSTLEQGYTSFQLTPEIYVGLSISF